MKPKLTQVGLLAGALWACSTMAVNAADPGRPYLNIDAGVNIVPDVDATISSPGFPDSPGTVEFDPGLRVGIAGGYYFAPGFSAELETGFSYNEVDGSDDVVLSHVPILANVVFRFDTGGPWVPFVGAGAGGVLSLLDFDNDDIDADESDTDFVFAWQAQAGLHYRFADNMSVGVAYKYLGVNSPDFEINDTNVEFDTVHNHSILGSFNWSF